MWSHVKATRKRGEADFCGWMSYSGVITCGLLLLRSGERPPRTPLLLLGLCSKLVGSRRDAFALDSAVAARAQFTCLAATNHSHQSSPGSGTRCLCFQQFYSNLVIFSDFGKFISEEGLAPTYLKVEVASKNNSMNKKQK